MRTSSQHGIDFTSVHYLGLTHGSEQIPRFRQLSSGHPAALRRPVVSRQLEVALAELQGYEDCVLGTSTLHLYCDLITALPRHNSIVMDSGAYAVARWATKLAAGRGMAVGYFQHGDVQSLTRELARVGGLPLVLMDDYCIPCGERTPLLQAQAVVERFGGWLVVDATQSFGVLGEDGCGLAASPLVSRASCVSIASLAKGWSAPVAALCHATDWLSGLRDRGTQVHCSPPTIPVLLAAHRALALNRAHGNALRTTLRERVALLRAGLRRLGLEVAGGDIPVLCVAESSRLDAVRVQRALQARGVTTVVLRGHAPRSRLLAFAVRASHSIAEIVRALEAVGRALRETRPRSRVRPGRERRLSNEATGTLAAHWGAGTSSVQRLQ